MNFFAEHASAERGLGLVRQFYVQCRGAAGPQDDSFLTRFRV